MAGVPTWMEEVIGEVGVAPFPVREAPIPLGMLPGSGEILPKRGGHIPFPPRGACRQFGSTPRKLRASSRKLREAAKSSGSSPRKFEEARRKLREAPNCFGLNPRYVREALNWFGEASKYLGPDLKKLEASLNKLRSDLPRPASASEAFQLGSDAGGPGANLIQLTLFQLPPRSGGRPGVPLAVADHLELGSPQADGQAKTFSSAPCPVTA